MPEGSALCFGWENGAWVERYGSSLTDEDRDIITKAIEQSIEETGALEGLPVFGQRFLEKRAQVAFAALGIDVPHDLKYTWDPDNERRLKLHAAVAEKLPQFEVTMGGATSIDIMKKGVNKSLGVRWLSEHLGISAREMLYVGDAFYESGNDAPVIPTGIQTRQTTGPAETLTIIDDLLTSCDSY
jgi:HAD superfamily hydrolase (TIGR01484 family)